MRDPNQICKDLLINSVELSILGENELAFELASLLSLKIIKGEFAKKVNDIIFQNSMEWMVYLEFKERSELKDKTPSEILKIVENL